MREGRDEHYHADDSKKLYGVGRVRLDDQQRQQERAEAARAKPADEEARLAAQCRPLQDHPLDHWADKQDRRQSKAQRGQQWYGSQQAGEDDAKEQEGEQHRHLRRDLAIFQKTIAERDIENSNGETSEEGGEKAIAAQRLCRDIGKQDKA